MDAKAEQRRTIDGRQGETGAIRLGYYRKQQTANSKQQTANSNQHSATAKSRRQTRQQRRMKSSNRIFIIAGPNGAGKTTFALEYLPHEADCPDFINVDLIAAGLSPFNPERAALRAGRLMLAEVRNRVRKESSFAFETTLSGHGYAQMIPRWRTAGYDVKLIFLALTTPELAIARVAARVAQGGHNVAQAVIRRRFQRSLRNFRDLYSPLVNRWEWYDNSGITPRLISTGENP